MREIKFRVWDKKYRTFEYNESPRILISTKGEVYEYGMQSYTEYDRSDDYVLSQYTGLKDSNGSEIYEGDINFNGGLVIFKDGAFLLKTKSGQDMLVKYQLEIIGNIYEDYPELLEG